VIDVEDYNNAGAAGGSPTILLLDGFLVVDLVEDPVGAAAGGPGPYACTL
jgi:hypothetical protein